ncbi:flavin monoamine oxidase family protein [Scytonema millei]|uniref:Flavin monoamine oxidase family protein n=1 Tax=Scytonema millei VB511283 TaxID=1245923 RepID=A0A9X5I422_9CYAN|nr:flavin monoamine oxidase family protein [Scytonema millei]NHC34112.1 flavin monoamine oxidase family protein [Scytonema millei VB511283]
MRRRDFITRLAASAGTTYAVMQALDLIEKPATAQKSPFQLQRRGGSKSIIILGAGLGGMTCAYELSKVGYQCKILEARERSGGRCWTVRTGDKFTDTLGQTQTIRFDRGLYFNPGPARIPYHHVTIDYCKELGVPLEVIVNLSRQQYIYRENAGSLSGRKVHAREAIADIRGYISELLAKAISKDAIDAPLTVEDKEKMIEFLRTYGGLNPDLFYKGSSRRGYSTYQGAGDAPGVVDDPYDLSALLELGFAGNESFEFGFNQQMTMFEPVGGMDAIAKAFEKQVGRFITYGAVVTEIRKTPDGVQILYKDKSGNVKQETADYCICNIPLSVLKDIPSDFAPDMKEAIASVEYAVTGKSALQFNRRFWEDDEDIFGGITQTDQDITQIWYPSTGYLSQKGVVLGYYNFGSTAEKVGTLAPADRVALSLEQGSKIHPQYNNHFEKGFSLFWSTVPYSIGGWAEYTTDVRTTYYPRLNQPDGNIYLCGEHLSYLTGWMAGAFESARLVSTQIATL